MTKRLLRLLLLWSFVVSPLSLFAFTTPGNPTGYVNDFAHVLTEEQKSTLEHKLSLFNASTTNEISVVTVNNLSGDYIEHYAPELFKAWGIGKEKNDNGVLLLIAIEDRKMRIEVGYGLEGALTDSISAEIIRNDLTPAFKQGDYYSGINNATDRIIEVTKGEYVASPSKHSWSGDVTEAFIFFIVLFFQGISFVASILGRSKSWWAGGLIGAVIGGTVTFFHILGLSTVVGLIITAVLTAFGLLFDYFVSNAYTSSVVSGGSIPWWAGGGNGGAFSGGSRSSSFGGFGGGSSGGGGASGSW